MAGLSSYDELPLHGTLLGSSGSATRPTASSHWNALSWRRQDSRIYVPTTAESQPRTSGDAGPCDSAEASCSNRPPAELSARLCAGKHNTGASAYINLGQTAVMTPNNKVHVWGWNTRCEITCEFGALDGETRRTHTLGGWETNGHEGTGLYPLDSCAGASTLMIRGGGQCGSCRIYGGNLDIGFLYKGPPFPPDAAPNPPPPWPPAPEAVPRSRSFIGIFAPIIIVAISLFILMACMCSARRRKPPARTRPARVPPARALDGPPVSAISAVASSTTSADCAPIVVMGVAVEEPRIELPPEGLTLKQKVDVLIAELGLTVGPVVHVANEAVRTLGLQLAEGATLAEKIEKAFAEIRSHSS